MYLVRIKTKSKLIRWNIELYFSIMCTEQNIPPNGPKTVRAISNGTFTVLWKTTFQQIAATVWFIKVLLMSEPNLSNQMIEYASGVTSTIFTKDAIMARAIDQSWSYNFGKKMLLEMLFVDSFILVWSERYNKSSESINSITSVTVDLHKGAFWGCNFYPNVIYETKYQAYWKEIEW